MPAQAMVGAHEGPAGDGSSQWPGPTSLGGRGVPPRQRSVLIEGMRGTAVPNGPKSPTSGGRVVLPMRQSVLMKGMRGTVIPNGWGPPAEETGRPAQAAVGAYYGPAADGSCQRPGPSS